MPSAAHRWRRERSSALFTLRGYTSTPGSGSLSVTGYPVGTVVESSPDSPKGRRVDYRSASGGASLSETDSQGSFRAALSGALERGTPAQERVMRTLIHLLRASGNEVRMLAGARDDRGEDGLLLVNGRRLVVQIVRMPLDGDLWEGTRCARLEPRRHAVRSRSMAPSDAGAQSSECEGHTPRR